MNILLKNVNYFSLDSSKKDGFYTVCKTCRGFEYGITNRSKILQDNDIKICKYCNEIKPKEKVPFIENRRIADFCEDCKEFYYNELKTYQKEYIAKNKQQKREYDKEYYKKNKEKRKEYYKQWKENGGKLIRQKNNRSRESKKKKLLSDLTTEQWNKILEYFNRSCAYCGITEKEHKQKYN